MDCSGYELERLHTKVTSLCNRIEQIQCYNAKDRLAQSGKPLASPHFCLLASCLNDYYTHTPAHPSAHVSPPSIRGSHSVFLCRHGQTCSQPAACGTEPSACPWCNLWLNARPSASPSAPAGSPHWPAPHAWGLCLGRTAQPHTVLPSRTDCWEPVSPRLIPSHSHVHSHSPHKGPLHWVDPVCHSLGCLWNTSSFPAAPSNILQLFRAFLNTEQSIRAFGTPKRSQASFYHPQDILFFFFFSGQ